MRTYEYDHFQSPRESRDVVQVETKIFCRIELSPFLYGDRYRQTLEKRPVLEISIECQSDDESQ